jgi:PleD family two-component response regulator
MPGDELRGHRRKLLIVDGDRERLRLFRLSLDPFHGPLVRTALTGKRALQLADSERPDMVIVGDVTDMPQMQLIELFRLFQGQASTVFAEDIEGVAAVPRLNQNDPEGKVLE